MAGLAGSFLGGLAARDAIGMHYRYSLLAGLILAVIFAAAIVAAIGRADRSLALAAVMVAP